MLFAAVQIGPGAALWSAADYLVVNVLVGSIIEPRFMGRGLGLSTLVVFLSLVFWGWVLGPVGMFLSVPLTMMIKIALASRPDTQWIAVLLGPEGAGTPARTAVLISALWIPPFQRIRCPQRRINFTPQHNSRVTRLGQVNS